MIIDKKVQVKKMQCKIEYLVAITIKYLPINQILALNKPSGVDMPLNK